MAKHEQVRDALLAGIQSGEFQPKSRLPAERELATRFGVSYVTARRAVEQLVEANLLERRPRSGTYVLAQAARGPSTNVVLLISHAGDSAFKSAFQRIGARRLEERGWQARILQIAPGDDDAAVRAIQSGALAVVLSTGHERSSPLAAAMQQSNGRAVLLANRMDDLGVPSVQADDSQALRLAVSHLHDHGHRDIALLCDHPSHPVARLQIAAWHAFCADEFTRETLGHRLIAVRSKSLDELAEGAYESTRAFLRASYGESVTALISLSEEMTLAALAACRDEGRPVPERISVVSLGDSTALAFSHPPVTWIDVDFEGHIMQALDILDAAEKETLDSADRLRLIEPHLIKRQSVAAPFVGAGS